MKWADYFLDIADVASTKSKDPETKVGAVIVGPEKQIVTTGFNGFPRQIDEGAMQRWVQPWKSHFMEHAERNAIYNAARHGIALRGCTLYLSGFGPPTVPCTGCARAIIQSGIISIIGRATKRAPFHWKDDLELARQMLLEAGISIVEYPREET